MQCILGIIKWVMIMSELCLDCYNKIMETNEPKRKFILSLRRDLCEECGDYKRVIVRVKWRYILQEEIAATIQYHKTKKEPSQK